MTPTRYEALGLTITAAMLFIAGAIGAWGRAKVSDTQIVFSQRTIVDMLIGGFGGVLLPIFAPILNKALLGDFGAWTAFQQAALAFFVGATGSYVWTVFGWRKGLIVTPTQAASGVKPPPPEPGVLKGTRDEHAAIHHIDTQRHKED
jgi:hypothetical protein